MDLRWWLVPCALATGCFAPDDGAIAGESFMDDDLPPWSCMDESGGSTGACATSGGVAAVACQGSADCPGGQVCSAVFDGDIGTFECQLVCVQNDDETSWCFDDDACCDTNASCVRGLCLPDGAGETTTTEGSSSSSSGDATGSSSAGSSESSTTTDGESSSGSAG